jgi:hypothetical protein
MPIFQCNGCPSGPCILTNMDPEFTPKDECLNLWGEKSNEPNWRELRAVE